MQALTCSVALLGCTVRAVRAAPDPEGGDEVGSWVRGVYSVTGAKVLEQRLETEARLDVASLPRGMYIVRVQNGLSESVVRIALK